TCNVLASRLQAALELLRDLLPGHLVDELLYDTQSQQQQGQHLHEYGEFALELADQRVPQAKAMADGPGEAAGMCGLVLLSPSLGSRGNTAASGALEGPPPACDATHLGHYCGLAGRSRGSSSGGSYSGGSGRDASASCGSKRWVSILGTAPTDTSLEERSGASAELHYSPPLGGAMVSCLSAPMELLCVFDACPEKAAEAASVTPSIVPHPVVPPTADSAASDLVPFTIPAASPAPYVPAAASPAAPTARMPEKMAELVAAESRRLAMFHAVWLAAGRMQPRERCPGSCRAPSTAPWARPKHGAVPTSSACHGHSGAGAADGASTAVAAPSKPPLPRMSTMPLPELSTKCTDPRDAAAPPDPAHHSPAFSNSGCTPLADTRPARNSWADPVAAVAVGAAAFSTADCLLSPSLPPGGRLVQYGRGSLGALKRSPSVAGCLSGESELLSAAAAAGSSGGVWPYDVAAHVSRRLHRSSTCCYSTRGGGGHGGASPDGSGNVWGGGWTPDSGTPRAAPSGPHDLPYAEWHPCVSVLFADICGFTQISNRVPAVAVMEMLNALYCRLDVLCASWGQQQQHQQHPCGSPPAASPSACAPVYKVQIIGDAYMVATGLLADHPAHAATACSFALAILREAEQVVDPCDGKPLRLRVGIHSGPVVSGVVGRMRRQYSVFGDTVNVASRMESTGASGAIHVSEDTQRLAAPYMPAGDYVWRRREGVEVKGKGIMDTYWLEEGTGAQQQG
ncbi:Soluble guanylate cyclase 88E, partial [Tetrabaena socialis]